MSIAEAMIPGLLDFAVAPLCREADDIDLERPDAEVLLDEVVLDGDAFFPVLDFVDFDVVFEDFEAVALDFEAVLLVFEPPLVDAFFAEPADLALLEAPVLFLAVDFVEPLADEADLEVDDLEVEDFDPDLAPADFVELDFEAFDFDDPDFELEDFLVVGILVPPGY